MRLLNYIKKYSDFYLSKYSVTKRKFEDILKQKLKKDFFKKKISAKDYEMFLEQTGMEELPEDFDWSDEVVVDEVKHCADEYYDSIVYNWFDEQ